MPVLDLKTMKVKGETLKEKAVQLGRNAKQKAVNAGRWVVEHPQEFVMIAGAVTAVTGGLRSITKGISKHQALRMEKYNKERYVYDHSLNAWLKTKRPLKSDDIKRINAIRRKTGMKLSEVLEQMHLLD